MTSEDLSLLGIVLVSLGTLLLIGSQLLIWYLGKSERGTQPQPWTPTDDSWERRDGTL